MDTVGAVRSAAPRCPGPFPGTRGVVQALLAGGESQESQSTCSRQMLFPPARADPAFLAGCYSPSTGEGEVKPADTAGRWAMKGHTTPL